MNQIIYRIIFCYILLFSTSLLIAQNTNNLLFNNYHFSFQVGYLNNKIEQVGNAKKGSFHLNAKKGGFVGSTLTIHPFKHFGLEVGANVSLQNFDYEVELKADDFGLNQNFNLKQNIPEVYLEVPLAIVPRYQLNDRNWLYAHLGMTMNWYAPLDLNFNLSTSIQSHKGEDLGFVQMTFKGDNPYFSALTGIGFQRLTKNKNLLGISLHTTFGFSKVLEGSYSILYNEITVNSGTFYSKGSYINLGFSYTFTGMKKLEEEINKLKIE